MKKNNENINKLIRCLEKTTHKNEDLYSVVGSEIRYRRLKMSRTLASFADIPGLSISHLCKIENNQIVPKKHVLNEICKSLDISDSKIEVLLSLKQILENMLVYYINGDLEKIKYEYERGKGLVNYRYMIIEFIYYITFGLFAEASVTSHRLLEFANVMNDSDVKIFSLFYAILLFYNEDYTESIRLFKRVEKTNTFSNPTKIITAKYLFTLYAKTNNVATCDAYLKIRDILIENGMFRDLDDVYFDYGIFLIRNRCFRELSQIYKNIKGKRNRRTIALYTKLVFRSKIYKKHLKDVHPYYYFLAMFQLDRSLALTAYEDFKVNPLDYRFENLIIQYKTLKTDGEKYYFIKDEALPVMRRSNNAYVNSFFTKEFNILSMRLMRYKDFAELMKDIGTIVW